MHYIPNRRRAFQKGEWNLCPGQLAQEENQYLSLVWLVVSNKCDFLLAFLLRSNNRSSAPFIVSEMVAFTILPEGHYTTKVYQSMPTPNYTPFQSIDPMY